VLGANRPSTRTRVQANATHFTYENYDAEGRLLAKHSIGCADNSLLDRIRYAPLARITMCRCPDRSRLLSLGYLYLKRCVLNADKFWAIRELNDRSPIVYHFSLFTIFNLRLAKDRGSMRFTELGLIVTGILENYNVVRYHLLHISFFLTKEGF